MKFLIFVAAFVYSFQFLAGLKCISKRDVPCPANETLCIYITYTQNGATRVDQGCASQVLPFIGGKLFKCEAYGTTVINLDNIKGKRICCDTNMCNTGDDIYPVTKYTTPSPNDNTATRIMGECIIIAIILIKVTNYIFSNSVF